MLDVLSQDYIRTARAKGMSEWQTVGKHALRNALILIITATGILLSAAIGGSVIIETGVRAAGYRPAWWCRRSWRGTIRWCRGTMLIPRFHLRDDQSAGRYPVHAGRSPGAP